MSHLTTYLGPLAPWLARTDVTDLFVNEPGEIWIETLGGGLERHAAPDLDEPLLWRLARQVAALTHQGVSREHPLLAAILPDGSRIQVCAPPCTRGPFALAIRKHIAANMTLEDHAARGTFEAMDPEVGPPDLAGLLQAGDPVGFLRAAVRARKTIVIAGGTSTGKTTFMNTLLGEMPSHERLLVIEDTPELRIPHANAVGLVAVRGDLGETRVGPEALLEASLRLRPDRIVLGELRGREAFQFLRAVNSGHPGSITTVHADSPAAACEQIALMALQAQLNLTRREVVDYVSEVVDVFIQLTRGRGRRRVTQITYEGRAF